MYIQVFENISPIYWASLSLIALTGFSILWYFDSRTHAKLVRIDILDKELQVHRNILAASVLMELSLISMYWFPLKSLPIFLAFFITRLVHEFIDEMHFHTDRCTVYESRLHLGMWIFVLIKTFALFIWGFFTQYNGIETLPFIFYLWAGLLFVLMSYTGFVEWFRK